MPLGDDRSRDAPKITSPVRDSTFQLDGVSIEPVRTRIWCVQSAEGQCDAASEGSFYDGITALLDIIRKPGYCVFEPEPLEDGTERELELSARMADDRWLVRVDSDLRASLAVAFLNASEGDLSVVDADFLPIELEALDLSGRLANFGDKLPVDLRGSDVMAVILSSKDTRFFGASIYVTNEANITFRPVILASSGGQIFAILGLGVPLK